MPKNVNKLLVANRGEIALRVVRTAREMGIPTVAVYAEQDRHAQYVQMADDAYLLSGDTYKDTYLNEDLLRLRIPFRSGHFRAESDRCGCGLGWSESESPRGFGG